MKDRRELLKGLAVGSVWAAPVVSSVVLPVHAQSSGSPPCDGPAGSCTGNCGQDGVPFGCPPCYCDDICEDFEDCCGDYFSECSDGPTVLALTGSTGKSENYYKTHDKNGYRIP